MGKRYKPESVVSWDDDEREPVSQDTETDFNPETILEEASRITSSDRNEDYGTPLMNHSRTAYLWGGYIGVNLTAEDVCMLNILQKISRGMNKITRDTLVDIAGYARNIEMIQDEKETALNGTTD